MINHRKLIIFRHRVFESDVVLDSDKSNQLFRHIGTPFESDVVLDSDKSLTFTAVVL